MVDRPEKGIPDPSPSLARDALLAALGDTSFVRKRVAELAQSLIVPSLFLIQATDSADDKKLAINYYTDSKFLSYGDERRYPSNTKARALAKKNIELHKDDAATIKDNRIIDVRLTDLSDKAKLSAWLIFPFAYKDSEHAVAKSIKGAATNTDVRKFAEYQRLGFELSMKKAGFDATGKTLPKAGLTPLEQLKLDCLTIKALTTQALSGEPLTTLEQKALDEAVARMNKTLASDKPDQFIKNIKAAFTSCKDPKDRDILLMGITALLADDQNGKKLIDSFEAWLATKYTTALEQQLHKDPKKCKEWIEKNAKDKLASFPKDTSPEELLQYLRKLHTEALGQRWKETMKAVGTDRGAFQDLTNIVLGKKDRFGAAAGLFEALNDVALRKDANKNNPAEDDKVVARIDKAGNDPAGKSSKARPPGEFVKDPIEISDKKWPWYSYVFGVPLAIGAADITGVYLTRGRLRPGWTIRTGYNSARDTLDVATLGKFELKDPVLKYRVPSEDELVHNSRSGRSRRAADPRATEAPLVAVEKVSFKGLEIVIPKGNTARDLVRELRRLENDKDFRRFLDDEIKAEEARRQEKNERLEALKKQKAEYEKLSPEGQAKVRRELIEEIYTKNSEMVEAARKGEARWRACRLVGVSLIAALAVGYVIKSLATKQEEAPPLIKPGVITKD